MPCLILLLGLLLPRVALVGIFLLTNWFARAFGTWIWPLLGFVFMPYATLAYMTAIVNAGRVTPGWLVLIIVAAVVDISHWGGGYKARRRRAPSR